MGLKYLDLTVIIPTLNEMGNIGRVISELKRLYPGVRIIVSDDGSTDGTMDEVLNIGDRDVRFLDRGGKKVHGLTASVVDASMLVRTRYIIVMDGDMQHPPQLVRRIYRKLRSYDVVVGVRVSVKNWGIHRIVLSKGITIISYVVFAIRGKPVTRDMMSGFFGIRSSFMKKIVRENRRGFVMRGYKVMLDMLRMAGPGTSICEVEYSTFHNRLHGKSKLRIRRMAEVLESIFKG